MVAGVKISTLVAATWGLIQVARWDVSALAPIPQPMSPRGDGAEVKLYDDGRLYLRAFAEKLEVDSLQEVIVAEGLSGGVLMDEKGKLRGQFHAGRLKFERTPGNVALEGGVALSASEGDIISAPTIYITKADKKIRFPDGIAWRSGSNNLSAAVAEADGTFKKMHLTGGVKATIKNLNSLALKRSKKTLQKRKVNSNDLLPFTVMASEAQVDEEAGTVDFLSQLSGSPVLLNMKHYRLSAETIRVYSKEKLIQVTGNAVLVRPAKKEKTDSDVAQAFGDDPATIRSQSFTWWYEDRRLDFPMPLKVVQPKRTVDAGTGQLDDKAQTFNLSGNVLYHQKEGPWAKRLKDYKDMDKDGQEVMTGPMDLKADFLSYQLATGAFTAGGDIRVQVKDRTMRGHEAFYEPDKKLWRLQGRVAYREKSGNTIFTELLTLDSKEDRVTLTGRTRVLLVPTEKMIEGYEEMAKDPALE